MIDFTSFLIITIKPFKHNPFKKVKQKTEKTHGFCMAL